MKVSVHTRSCFYSCPLDLKHFYTSFYIFISDVNKVQKDYVSQKGKCMDSVKINGLYTFKARSGLVKNIWVFLDSGGV